MEIVKNYKHIMQLKEAQKYIKMFTTPEDGMTIIAPYDPKRRQCVITDNPVDFYLYELNNYEL